MPAAALIRRPALALLALVAIALAAPAYAQEKKGETKEAAPAYEPQSGQQGKDVVWVPTPQVLVDKMLDMAKVTRRDFVIDLGSGDGRTVITAAKRGARAMGIEYNPDMVELSKRNAEREGVSSRATFMKADLFETSFSRATVITMFLLPSINVKLRPKILALKPGTRIVANSFDMGDWIADETVTLTPEMGCDTSWCTALLWIVPVRAAGTYKTPQGELVLKQAFQRLSGTFTSGGKTTAVEGSIRGEDISFRTDGREFRARLNGGNLEIQ
jgi:SAM-dependent methyltransferase